MSPNRSSILVVCLVAALALSGCAGQQLTDEQEQQVVEQFEDRMSEIDGYHAVVTTSATFNNQTFETKSEVWARTDTGEMRQEILEPEDRAGSRTVSNGSVMWTYNAAKNTATRVEVPEMGNTNMVPQVSSLVERYDIYSNGTVDLNGTETHKLTLVPNESAGPSLSGSITMWVDTERLFPVQMSMDFAEMTSTVRYRNLTLNPEFEPGTFEFDPPADVEIRTPSTPDVSQFDAYEALTEATEYAVPDPALPDGFEFQRGSLVDGNRTTVVSLEYTDGNRTLTVTATDSRGSTPSGGESVAVGDRTGTYTEFGSRASVTWNCRATTYSAHGDLTKETLVDIATAIDC